MARVSEAADYETRMAGNGPFPSDEDPLREGKQVVTCTIGVTMYAGGQGNRMEKKLRSVSSARS